MGLLDEAIREHLDLQRRRGADPTEVERAEREALGPVRRAPESAPGADDEAHDPDGLEFESPDADLEAFAAGAEPKPVAYQPESHEPATEVARPPEREATFDHEADSWSYEDATLEPDVAAPLPSPAEPPPAESEDDVFAEPSAAPPPHQAPAASGGETEEYDVEAALNSDRKPKGAEGEDVLEETPEFLQDTPDHDRLWFEQRPPKDFDFDG